MKSECELVAKYHDIHETVDKMGKALLELMRHPDATAEQLDEGRLKYFVTYNTWVQARIELRKLYPAKPINPFQRELPWNQKL